MVLSCGPSRAIGYADYQPGSHSDGYGSCEERRAEEATAVFLGGQGYSAAVVGMVVGRAQRQVAALFCERKLVRQLLTLAYVRVKISAHEGG